MSLSPDTSDTCPKGEYVASATILSMYEAGAETTKVLNIGSKPVEYFNQIDQSLPDLRFASYEFFEAEIFGEPYSEGRSYPPSGITPVCEVRASPNYPLMNRWMQMCKDAHKDCQPVRSHQLKHISLIEVRTRRLQAYNDGDEYVALSYVWGNTKQPHVLDDGKLPEQIPRTIEDAMAVVNGLGLRFLWVDSFCIDQRDSSSKMEQISIMNHIYEGAAATIIDLHGNHADCGLPGLRVENPRKRQRYAEFLLSTGERRHLLSRCPAFVNALTSSTWNTRGWTFQEALLSRRCFFFTKHQVYFRCHDLYFSEDLGTLGIEKMVSATWRFALIHLSADSIWSMLFIPKLSTRFEKLPCLIPYEVCRNQYVRRKLTYSSDAINAFTAILNKLQATRMMTHGFHYGLPRANFRRSLLWHVWTRKRLSRGSQMPSWSWAGWQFNWAEAQNWFQDGMKGLPCELSITIPLLRLWVNGGLQELDLDIGCGRHENEEEESLLEVKSRRIQNILKPIWNSGELYCPFPLVTTAPVYALKVEGLLCVLPVRRICGTGPLRVVFSNSKRWVFGKFHPVEYSDEHQGSQSDTRDLLLLDVDVDGDDDEEIVTLRMISLLWQDGIALREDVVWIPMPVWYFPTFWKEALPRLAQFWWA